MWTISRVGCKGRAGHKKGLVLYTGRVMHRFFEAEGREGGREEGRKGGREEGRKRRRKASFTFFFRANPSIGRPQSNHTTSTSDDSSLVAEEHHRSVHAGAARPHLNSLHVIVLKLYVGQCVPMSPGICKSLVTSKIVMLHGMPLSRPKLHSVRSTPPS